MKACGLFLRDNRQHWLWTSGGLWRSVCKEALLVNTLFERRVPAFKFSCLSMYLHASVRDWRGGKLHEVRNSERSVGVLRAVTEP